MLKTANRLGEKQPRWLIGEYSPPCLFLYRARTWLNSEDGKITPALTVCVVFRPTENATVGGSSMERLCPLLLLMVAYAAFGHKPDLATNSEMREVKGQTIISNTLPKAELTFGEEFRYVGSQRVNLYGNAEAEQHLFVEADGAGLVVKFYWVQFEHFFPTNTRKYDYSPEHTTKIGRLGFIYDVKSWPDYARMQSEDPQSDGAAVERLLAEHNLRFPKQAMRVRMFHLPTPDRRSELDDYLWRITAKKLQCSSPREWG